MKTLKDWFGRQVRGTPPFVWVTLVVICGCGGLVLWPVIQAAKPMSTKTHCLSNLKHIAGGFMMYAVDHDERLPAVDGWMDKLKPYNEDSNLYYCPAARAANESAYGYAYDSRLAKRRLDNLARPEEAPLVYDSSSFARSAADPFTSLPDPPRHDEKNNVANADGSVRQYPPESDPGPVKPAGSLEVP